MGISNGQADTLKVFQGIADGSKFFGYHRKDTFTTEQKKTTEQTMYAINNSGGCNLVLTINDQQGKSHLHVQTFREHM